jgi:hypothetical protein
MSSRSSFSSSPLAALGTSSASGVSMVSTTGSETSVVGVDGSVLNCTLSESVNPGEKRDTGLCLIAHARMRIEGDQTEDAANTNVCTHVGGKFSSDSSYTGYGVGHMSVEGGEDGLSTHEYFQHLHHPNGVPPLPEGSGKVAGLCKPYFSGPIGGGTLAATAARVTVSAKGVENRLSTHEYSQRSQPSNGVPPLPEGSGKAVEHCKPYLSGPIGGSKVTATVASVSVSAEGGEDRLSTHEYSQLSQHPNGVPPLPEGSGKDVELCKPYFSGPIGGSKVAATAAIVRNAAIGHFGSKATEKGLPNGIHEWDGRGIRSCFRKG